VEVRFSEGAAFDILGSVQAIADMNEILFTGSSKLPGYWGGIRVSGAAYLSNVRIEYGGKLQQGIGNQSNLELHSDGIVSLENVSLQHGLKYGLTIDDGEVLSASNVDVSLNGIAGKIDIKEINEISDGFRFSGNTSNVIELDVSGQVNDNLTIKNVGADYQVVKNISIHTGGISIEPDVSLLMDQGVEFEVLSSGYFRAIGTFDNPILFTSSNSSFSWNGILINQSSSESNELSNVIIENAGAGEGSAAIYLNCTSSWNGYLKVSDISVSNSRGWGISVGPENCVLDFAGEVTYSGNDLGNLLMRMQ
jgi:hypothetical protein